MYMYGGWGDPSRAHARYIFSYFIFAFIPFIERFLTTTNATSKTNPPINSICISHMLV